MDLANVWGNFKVLVLAEKKHLWPPLLRKLFDWHSCLPVFQKLRIKSIS